jgi:hypothetical protein
VIAFPRAAWAIVAGAVPLHLWLALGTDLSPDEAYYLCAARRGGGLVDHPPLVVWLLRLSDRWASVPVELRVRVWPVVLAFATGLAIVELARRRGAGREGCLLAAWVGSWALLPTAGGFVCTPDGPLLCAFCAALLLAGSGRDGGPESPPYPPGRTAAAGLALCAGALAKVVALPLGVALAVAARGRRRGRVAMALLPFVALPLLLPSLRFQLRHAYAPVAGAWSPGTALGALLAAASAQALLWSPFVLVRGLRRLAQPERTIVVAMTALVVVSALVRAVPPEPNWWAPAALALVVAGAAHTGAAGSPRARAAVLASVLLPTLIASAHTLRPFLPLPPDKDPTARLHGWSSASPPADAPGVGPYGPAAERCVYSGSCDEIERYFSYLNAHEGS